MFSLFCFAAWALPTLEADRLEAEWKSLQLLRADPDRYRIVEEPFTLSEGPLSLTITEGVLVPVFSGHTPRDRRALRELDIDETDHGTMDFVGFAFSAATGTATVTWQERADQLIFANHMVRNLKHPKADFEAVADGEPWTDVVSEGLILSIDPAVEAAFMGPDDGEGDPFEVVVYGDKPRLGARARAVQIVENRVALMKRAGIDPGRQIASDRVAAARGLAPATGQHLVLDLHGATHLGSVMDPSSAQPKALRWMTLLRDDTGVLDPRRQSVVSAFDVSAGGRIVRFPITGMPFPPLDPDDPLSPPAAPVRMEAYDSYTNILVAPRAADVEVFFTARLKLRAVGGPLQWFELQIPRAGTKKQFEVQSAQRYPDGAELLATNPMISFDPVFGSQTPEEEDDEVSDDAVVRVDKDKPPPPKRLQADPYLQRPESRITIALPEPLEAGEVVIIDVSWQDVWSLTNMRYVVPSPGVEIGISLGAGSGRRDFLPRLAGAPTGNPSRFRARVAVPTRSKLKVALSGVQQNTSEEGDWTFFESGYTDHAVTFANVAVARFAVHDESADGFPTIRTRMLDTGDGPAFAQEARRVIQFYQGYLPTYPWPEHEVFQGPGALDGWVWVASHEMTNIMKTRTSNSRSAMALARVEHTAAYLFAHELAHQWWGHLIRPVHREDFWISETFAEEFSCIYLDAVFGICSDSMERKRTAWESSEDQRHIPRASLTAAYSSPSQPSIVYDYGPYVFHTMLRARMGHTPYHAALDLLLVDHAHEPLTTERLLAYINLASEKDRTDFFDFWVFGGFVPEDVQLRHRFHDGRLHLEVTSDVPFGTFDVAVAIDGFTHWIDVVDGHGNASIPLDIAPDTVALDPDALSLIKRRRDTPE
jgi:hypothetical protein